MKRSLSLLSSLFILIATSIPIHAIQLEEKGKKTELEIEMYEFWHNTYLGLEEDKSGGFDIYKRTNREIFEQTKKSIKKEPFFEQGFTSDSISTKGAIILSISRFPNGRIKEIIAKYIHKNPRFELNRSLCRAWFYESAAPNLKGRAKRRQINEHFAGSTIAYYLGEFMFDIQDNLRGRIYQIIVDSVLAILNGTSDISPTSLGQITGQALDSVTDKPVPGAEVELVFRYASTSALGMKTNTNGKGLFEFSNIPVGDWSVVIRYGCCQAQHNISVKESDTVSIGPVKLNAFPYGYGRITGQVLDSAANEPLKGAKVRLYCPNWMPTELGTVTDEKGKFEVVEVPSGTWHIIFNYDPTHLSGGLHNINIGENETVSIGVVKLIKPRVVITE